MYYVKKTTRKPVKGKRKKIVKKSKGTKNSLVKTIKAVVNRQAETKHIDMNPLAYSFTNEVSNNTLMFNSVSISDNLSLPQGNTDGTRVGNSINITKCVLNMNILASSSDTLPPCIVSIYVGYLKPARSSPPGPQQFINFLQDGSTSTGLDNTTLSLLRNVNKDLFTITNKCRFKIGQSISLAISNNDFPSYVNKKLSIKSLLGKMVYNDTSNSPSKDLYIWAHFTGITGEIMPASSAPTVNYYLDTEYKDF